MNLSVLVAALSAAQRPVVLVDGGAGSGKSTWAAQLLQTWTGPKPEVVCTDEFCPGWDGLHAAIALVPQVITENRFQSWDWLNNQPGPVRELDPSRGLIIEGCGALSAASRELATLAVWLEASPTVRKQRALTRDGELFAPHWERWAAQEAQHWAADEPWKRADLRLDTD